MKNPYNKDFLETSILMLQDELLDVELWSVHNEDKLNELIGNLRKSFEALKEKVTETEGLPF